MYVIMARQLGLSDKEIAAFQKDVNKENDEYQKKLEALADDAHLRNGLNVYAGDVTCEAVAQALGCDYRSAEEALGI